MKKQHLGDNGETSVVGGRVPKDDLRVEAYGTIDELNSAIGLARTMSDLPNVNEVLEKIQMDLFVIGADLATKTEKGRENGISVEDVARLEEFSAKMENDIKPINMFVLPSGSQIGAALHLSRAICRRAERRIVSLSKKEKVNPEIIRYINRLSDLLFIMARLVNQKLGVKESTWGPKGILGI